MITLQPSPCSTASRVCSGVDIDTYTARDFGDIFACFVGCTEVMNLRFSKFDFAVFSPRLLVP